jgi:hypothetical protein
MEQLLKVNKSNSRLRQVSADVRPTEGKLVLDFF